VIIKQHTQGIDFFSFAPAANNSHVYDNLVNHIQILDRYIPYYLEKADKLIKLSEQNSTYIPHQKIDIFNKMYQHGLLQTEQQLIKALKLDQRNRFIAGDVVISKREMDCLKALMQGMTCKEAAQAIHLSPRTVEAHIKNMKRKLHCRNLPQLVAHCFKHGLLHPDIDIDASQGL